MVTGRSEPESPGVPRHPQAPSGVSRHGQALLLVQRLFLLLYNMRLVPLLNGKGRVHHENCRATGRPTHGAERLLGPS